MKTKLLTGIVIIFVAILAMPQNFKMPVQGATKADYNPNSFWFYPWGKSVTHKGVDIFAKKGTEIRSATKGIVLLTKHNNIGGKIVLILGPKWRLHYYAHLNEINTSPLSFVSQKTPIATVGDSGNAKGKPPHLHYSIVTILPYPWRIDNSKQGWKKMFYLNPIVEFETKDAR